MAEMLDLPGNIIGLGASLGVGMLIGLERGWRDRALPQGGRAAGLRTFTLTGLLAGILASLPEGIQIWSVSAGLVGISALMAIAYWRGSSQGNQSITTAIALLLTYALAVYAAMGNILTALGLAVITTVLLNQKETLHGWLLKIEPQELRAGLQLLVLSVVILPVLPDAPIGPYEALNPYRLWWAVILVAGLSLAGHVAMRVLGARQGVLWTGLLGGLASSTACTLALSRLVRNDPALTLPGIVGALAATATMAIRLVLILFVLQRELFHELLLVFLVMAIVLLLPAIWMHFRPKTDLECGTHPPDTGIAPYGLQTALMFALFLGVVSLAVPLVRDWLGREGVFLVAALSGLADVDAITISLAALLTAEVLPIQTVSAGIGIAVFVNFLSKWGMTLVVGSRQMAWGVALGYLAALVCALIVAFIMN